MRHVNSMDGGHCYGHMFGVDAIHGLVGYLRSLFSLPDSCAKVTFLLIFFVLEEQLLRIRRWHRSNLAILDDLGCWRGGIGGSRRARWLVLDDNISPLVVLCARVSMATAWQVMCSGLGVARGRRVVHHKLSMMPMLSPSLWTVMAANGLDPPRGCGDAWGYSLCYCLCPFRTPGRCTADRASGVDRLDCQP